MPNVKLESLALFDFVDVMLEGQHEPLPRLISVLPKPEHVVTSCRRPCFNRAKLSDPYLAEHVRFGLSLIAVTHIQIEQTKCCPIFQQEPPPLVRVRFHSTGTLLHQKPLFLLSMANLHIFQVHPLSFSRALLQTLYSNRTKLAPRGNHNSRS